MPWTEASKPHLRHIRDLEQMLYGSARREYSVGNEPPGFVEYWDRYFHELFVVACLMYLERVFGTDSYWRSSTSIAAYPDLLRTMESLRCVRNCIVHNGCRINPARARDAQIIRDYDRDVRAGGVKDEMQDQRRPNGAPHFFEPYYTINPDDSIDLGNSISKVRWRVVAYLMAEGKMVPTS